jgi:signal transduction histidine kinase
MASKVKLNPYRKIIAASTWLVFTVSLATWWLVFAMEQLDQLRVLQPDISEVFVRKHRMLMWEGVSLIFLLASGGVALIYFIYRENRRYREVKEFFAAFTHDLKTSLASLRLQAESLQEDVATSENVSQNRLLQRLLKDSVRLELQLENSLFLANVEANQMFIEALSISRLTESLRHQWPEIEIQLQGEASVLADQRALESIFKNLIQNAIVHGQANRLSIQVGKSPGAPSEVQIQFQDDGAGFSGDASRLGHMFVRQNSRSGSAMGLYLARELVRKMNGHIEFLTQARGGFSAVIQLRSPTL